MRFWLAPLHGITNYIFRNCLFRHTYGIELAITPFLPIQCRSKLNVNKWKDILPTNNQGYSIIPQLMGNNANDFSDTIQVLHEEFGYESFNWNIGCPVSQIVKRKRGCGIMSFPNIVQEVINAAQQKGDFHISVKMRLGMNDVSEGLFITQLLNDYPLDYLIIHPRLGNWQYLFQPDIESFKKMQALSKHHLVYSGDITDIASFNQITQELKGIDQWMLGRGILRNPFLAEELINNNIQPIEIRRARFKSFYEDLMNSILEVRDERGILANFKELWHYFAYFFHLSDDELSKLLRTNEWSSFLEKSMAIIEKE